MQSRNAYEKFKNKSYVLDEIRCDFYNDEIFYEFMNGIRTLRCLEWNEGCRPSTKMMVFSWYDRGIVQMPSMLNEKGSAMLSTTH